jgi:hypothetical protein
LFCLSDDSFFDGITPRHRFYASKHLKDPLLGFFRTLKTDLMFNCLTSVFAS